MAIAGSLEEVLNFGASAGQRVAKNLVTRTARKVAADKKLLISDSFNLLEEGGIENETQALNRLAQVMTPAQIQQIRENLNRGDKLELEELAFEAGERFKRAEIFDQFKDNPKALDNAITRQAENLMAKGDTEGASKLVTLRNKPHEERVNIIKGQLISSNDIKNVAKGRLETQKAIQKQAFELEKIEAQRTQFQPILDDKGNEIGQVDIRTGKKVSSPLAPDKSQLTKEQKNFNAIQDNPKFGEFLEKTGSENAPAAVKEFNFWKGLTPEKQKQFIALKSPAQDPFTQKSIATQRAIGEFVGITRVKLPKLKADSTRLISQIDNLLNHPGLKAAVGAKDISTGLARIPGTQAEDFRVALAQIDGAAFVQAFQDMKGGGPITDIEGQRATDALARLSMSQSEPEFKRALKEFKSIVESTLTRAQGIVRRGDIDPTLFNKLQGGGGVSNLPSRFKVVIP